MAHSSKTATSVTALKFEDALAELEALIHTMEDGKLELEASLTAYQRGMALLQHCQGQLTVAEQKIQLMESEQAEKSSLEEKQP